MRITLKEFDNDYIIEKLKEMDGGNKLPKDIIIFEQIEAWKKDNLFYNTTGGYLRSKKHGILSEYSNKRDIIEYITNNFEGKKEVFEEEILNDLYCYIINKNWYF